MRNASDSTRVAATWCPLRLSVYDTTSARYLSSLTSRIFIVLTPADQGRPDVSSGTWGDARHREACGQSAEVTVWSGYARRVAFSSRKGREASGLPRLRHRGPSHGAV